jgi:type II secretory pathway component GspD/PulD (secretin)
MIFSLTAFAAVADTTLKVIALNNRSAEEIQPLIAPFLDPSDRVMANGSSLIIRSTPERLIEIEQLIKQLDKPLNNLLISVAQGRNISAKDMNARAKIKANITINQPSASNVSIKGHFDQNESHSANNITQQVRTLDGQPAYIQTGNAYPVQTRQLYSGYPTTTEYVDATTGFVVTPRLRGAQVIIEVSPWSNRMQRNGVIETRGAQTTIKAQLGEWVEIGGSIEVSQFKQEGILSRSRNSSQDEMQLLIKVETLH